MKRNQLSKIIFLLLSMGIIGTIKPQSEDITVKIEANVEKGDGFGIVVYEKNDTLYIATAAHVVISNLEGRATEINVRFKDIDKPFSPAEIVDYNGNDDIALLKIKKPSKYRWEFRSALGDANIGAKVGVVGRNGTWNPTKPEMMGRISFIKYGTIKADFNGAQEGNSGGPLINHKGKIVGMITEDAGNQITGISIKRIKQKTIEWLSIKDVSIIDIPYFNIGLQSGVIFPFSTNTEKNLQFDWGVLPPLEIQAEAVFAKKFSVRYSYSSWRLKTKEEEVEGINYRFRNSLNSHTISLLFYPESSLLEMVTGHIVLGASYITMDPELNINGVGWVSYEEASNISISRDSFSINFGFGASQHYGSGLVLSGELLLSVPFNEFLYIDVSKPLSEDQNKELLVSFGLKIGYSFRKKSSRIKLIR